MSYSDFAEKVGLNKSELTRLVAAKEVVDNVCNRKDCNDATLFIATISEKTIHLYEISKAPKQAWLPLSQLLVDKANTVSKIKNYVKLIKQIVDYCYNLSRRGVIPYVTLL